MWILCDITTTLYDITRLYSSHHIHTTHDITPTVYDITYTLLWHHSHCNYDKTPTMFVTLCSVHKTSHMVNEWQHNECIGHDTQCVCVIKLTWLMTSHPMYEWNHTHCMYDTIGTLYDITFTIFFLFSLICGGFCHTLRWKSHGFTCFPHPNPHSHLPLHPFPLAFPSAPGPSSCLMHPMWAGDLFHPR